MLSDLYIFGDSRLHRLRPSVKLGMLVLFCTLLFVFEGWATLGPGAALVALGLALSGLRAGHVARALRPALWILLAIFIVQAWLAGPVIAAFVVVRFAVLILAAAVLTATTRASEMVDGILTGLAYAPGWLPKERIALGISLCLRFIPLVLSVYHEVREAQRARGMGRNPTALLVPLVVRSLKTADEMAQAIDARSFD